MRTVYCHLFYAGKYVDELSIFPSMGYLGPELYNGAFLLIDPKAKHQSNGHWFRPGHWYRPDGTPYPTEQVPAELRTLALLLT